MRFRILGTLRIEDAPGVSGRRTSMLAAMLVANVNKSVSVDRLVDAVWEKRPPVTAREQVQNCVSMLRRGFGGANGVTISRSGRGYQLNADPSEIDAHCFERDVRAAAEHLAAGQPEAGVATYRDALALWSGPALDGLDGVELRAHAHRLDELRAAATERLIETQIELGRLDEAVADLRCLTRLNPTGERFMVLLVDALLLCHRHPEALAAYRDFARSLADELGTRPGPAARAAERRIHEALRDDGLPPTAGDSPARTDRDLMTLVSVRRHPTDATSQEWDLLRHLQEAVSHIHAAYSLLPSRAGSAVERLSGHSRVA
ncbi:AfsR/SARP family transcriptional regulator [Micromonospora narathiwatensis]|uniref:DNA-binding transcriptional activator of the SARP family n=1 Tax=Micromonospora narathiwatensis TaxID=299146 RepID=A0A1A9AED1_9ACTN|nr:BTAD domain-containing putative transcriptional regulator [Micromonospora narathiwatensis]SBT54494.1 DNA-binding transcriptional activator of the SARP family [Micromonospora narathiwatensis]